MCLSERSEACPREGGVQKSEVRGQINRPLVSVPHGGTTRRRVGGATAAVVKKADPYHI
jgi:hypothetical protein